MSIPGPARPAITLKELAAMAGVHPSTISRVANGDRSLRIGSEKRERIEALLRETQYRPNGIARSLKLRQSFVLGVIVPDVTNPFFAAVYRGVEDAALPRGYNVILCNTDGSPDRERAQLRMLSQRRVDGVILASAYLNDPSVARLRTEGVAHVLVNRFSDEQHDAFVGSDDLAGGRLVTEHLAAQGHRRIGHLSGPRSVSTSALRMRGYHGALQAAGLRTDPTLVAESGFVEEGGLRAGLAVLGLPADRRPTALFAVNDLAALGAYAAARQLGLRIPDDVAVAGYNDIPAAARVEPGLTTIQVPVHEVGAISARMLIDQIESGARERRRVVFVPQLVVRGSTRRVDTRQAAC
jgi:LacI family transcriptional regulator